MPNYIRPRVEGRTYFMTVVTHERRHILCTDLGRKVLREAFEEEIRRRPFAVEAIVLLPDHLHFLMHLPPGDTDYPIRMSRIKKAFTSGWLAGGGTEGDSSASRQRQRYRGVWQKRFWDHLLRDTRDRAMHMDYIHINPVRHGLVQRPADWPWSSFHRYVRAGRYEPDWCGHVELPGGEYLEP